MSAHQRRRFFNRCVRRGGARLGGHDLRNRRRRETCVRPFDGEWIHMRGKSVDHVFRGNDAEQVQTVRPFFRDHAAGAHDFAPSIFAASATGVSSVTASKSRVIHMLTFIK